MYLTILMLGVVLGQAAPTTPPRPTAPEMVADALVLPPGSKVTGQPLTLSAALAPTSDRRRQLEIVHAYWRLAEVAAIYRFSQDYDEQLRRLTPAAEESAALSAARASAAALLGEAELAAVAAQHELAASAMLPADAPLPLVADRPHVGPYLTHYNELFSMRIAPARARLRDRTLPILCRAIDGRAAAAQAAEEAAAAAAAEHGVGQVDLRAVLACLEQNLQQRQALMAAVCRYNRDIAEYALTVAAPGIQGPGLVRMLIEPVEEPLRPIAVEVDPAVEPAALSVPLAPTPAARPARNVPTPARSRPLTQQPARQVPTPAKRWQTSPKSDAPPSLAPQSAPPSLPSPSLPEPESDPPPAADPPMVPVEPKPAAPNSAKTTSDARLPHARHVGNEPHTTLSPLSADPPTVRPQARDDGAPQDRPQDLMEALFRASAQPEDAGERLELADCLRSQRGGDRQTLIAAYWRAQQRAAERQVVARQAELLDALAGASPDDALPSAQHQFRSARLATEAALEEVYAAIIEAQFDLALRMGRVAGVVWPTPSTLPRAAPFPLGSEAASRPALVSWELRRLSATIPALGANVERHAAAVAQTEAAREAIVAAPGSGPSSPRALESISRQTNETLAFLQSLTDYNQAIADYVLAVSPPDTTADQLAAAWAIEE